MITLRFSASQLPFGGFLTVYGQLIPTGTLGFIATINLHILTDFG